MHVNEVYWSDSEQKIARQAFKIAFDREIEALIQEIRYRVGALSNLDELWQLHNFLSARRHEIDGKYDDDPSAMTFVFSTLVKQGWLDLDELTGLERTKLAKISALSRM
jgi:Photoprotection regulator fluorescence recovery protein